MKLFLKSFRRHRIFEKRRHPKTFPFLSMICFQTLSYARTAESVGRAVPASYHAIHIMITFQEHYPGHEFHSIRSGMMK
ncbi:hypothetical protein F1645_10865 [Novacetimonas hansenii]